MTCRQQYLLLTKKMQWFESVDLVENRIQSLLPIREMFEMNIHNHLVESSSILIRFIAITAGTIVQ